MIVSIGTDTTRAEDVGLSAKRLTRIGTVLQRYVDQDKLPGVI
jgi:hypothetical protein